ncbi:carbohydrate-binding module family 18 protein [Coniochaeta sp. 2T2.1]|nr:carbohydrate-binding module family 18 protein [Coniochaeta sp. 2T2.1]
MFSIIPLLLLLPAAALGSIIPTPPAAALIEDRAAGAVSPNKTCGLTGAGLNNGFTCPETDACCSQYGFCGTGDSFCLTSAGCQAAYSNNTRTTCQAPRSGTTVSVDGTCGATGAGKAGYRCPATGATCCSA